jgi:hypothetical protein
VATATSPSCTTLTSSAVSSPSATTNMRSLLRRVRAKTCAAGVTPAAQPDATAPACTAPAAPSGFQRHPFCDLRTPRRAAPAVTHDGAWALLAAATCGLATGICLGEAAFLILRAGAL